VIVSLSLANFDGLRLCSQIRSLERTRNVPILAVSEADNNQRLVRGLEIGVNDYLIRPIDKNELLARVRTQIKKKRYTERLRDNVQASIEMAITDALTGLFNCCRKPTWRWQPWWPSASAAASPPSPSPFRTARTGSTSPSPSASPRRATRPPSSSAPTPRSIAPSATAATGWCRTPPDGFAGAARFARAPCENCAEIPAG
jgi:hypothetical protein